MKNKIITALPTRRIQIVGQIDDDNQRLLFAELSRLEEENSKHVIEIELTSEGGYVDNAMGIVGRMRQSPCKIVVTGYGVVASAAVIILASGAYRRLSKESRVMVHEDSGKLKGTITDLEKSIAHCRHQEHKWNHFMALRTGTTSDKWAKLHSQGDTFLSAEGCLDLGMVDEII